MFNTLVVHTNELILKGGNRSSFERQLADNLKAALRAVPTLRLQSNNGGTVIFYADEPLSAEGMETATKAVERVFGVAAFMFAVRVSSDFEQIAKAAESVCSGLVGSFKVVTRRRDKKFPMGSMEISAEVGGRILDSNEGLRVDVHSPESLVEVSVDKTWSFVSVGRMKGAGGLPTGTSGRVVALLSGGIDSPAAAWKLMRRGCEAVTVHFHSYPYVGQESLDKAERLAKVLAGWQGEARLWLVPLADAQREIATKCDESMRVVLYRRMMIRIAEELARREEAKALVTGDAVGQVASQTLDNLQTVSEAASLPIFRPLIGDDKEDITTLAKRVGSYDISIEPHGDCCSLFMPKKPATHADVSRARHEEEKFDVAGLVARAVEAAELKIVTP